MADFMDILRQRRSIRAFEKKPLAKEQIALLKEALLRSPTSRGRNPWQFIIVTEKKLLESLSHAKAHGSGFIANASIAFVVCGDETVSDVWIEDCSIAAITVQYAAAALGLGSCWAQIRLREHDSDSSAENYIHNLLNIPQNIRVASVIGVGYPAEEKSGHPADSLPFEKFHQNRF